MDLKCFRIVIFVVLAIAENAVCSNSTTTLQNIDKELLMTKREKVAFQEFKSAVHEHIPKQLQLLRSDLFLLRFIRAKGLDVEFATKEMFEGLKFIHDNNVLKTLKTPEWKNVYEDFPLYYISDRIGRPVLVIKLEEGWNVRDAIISGRQLLFQRYIWKIVVELSEKLVEAAKLNPNVTQDLIVTDMRGFNLAQHGCPSCIFQYLQILEVIERWMPGYDKENILINTPSTMSLVFSSIKPLLNPRRRESFKVFGHNKQQWKNYLDERIESSQLEKVGIV